MRILRLTAISVLLALSSCGKVQMGDFSVCPLPEEMTMREGDPFVFGRRVVIQAPKELETIAGLLAEDLDEALGIKPEITDNKGDIILSIDPSIPVEGYRIECEKSGIRIKGGGEAGVLYGAKAVYKALPLETGGRVALPAAVVADAPQYPYRGTY